ncbi:MAG: DNA polymerase III subunit gamma/tau [Burkholderiaceae bacterium]
MSYLVLARKYRSRNFQTLVGQEHVVQALSNALTNQRLHHAYLFTGTRGVGKTSIARILAKSLNCTGADGQGGITAQPCGVCDACREIDAGRFVDYVELDAASNRGVDEITQLLDQAVYKPVLGRFKVYMIDEVHMLSTTAFNAMLKTLEEPPDYLKFVLATTDPQKVPPTVLSRCLQFNLRPMAPQTVQAHLADVLAQEGLEAEPGALRLLARAARGSMRDGLSLTDQAIAFGAGRIDEAQVRQMLGSVDRSHALRLVQALGARDGAALIAAVDGLRALGLSAAAALEEMAALLQQAAVLQAVPDAADPEDGDAGTLADVAQRFAADELQLLYSIVLHGRAEIALAPDDYSGMVMVLLRWLAFAPADAKAVGSTAAVGSGAEPVAAAARPPPARTPSPTPARALAPPAVVTAAPSLRAELRAAEPPPPWLEAADAPPSSRQEAERAPIQKTEPPPPSAAEAALGDRWSGLVARLVDGGSIAALVRELAWQAQCVEFDAGASPQRIRLRVEREMLRNPVHVDKLQAALSELLREPVRVEVVPGPARDTPAERDAAQRARRQAEAEQAIHADPLVRSLMAQYTTARIVPGSVKPV